MLLNIQCLRAVAAYLVILYHWKFLLQDHYDVVWLEAGRAGVDLFFVISGFIMVYISAQKPIRPEEFLISRIVRIVPLYWLLTLIIFAIAVASPTFFGAIRPDVIQLLKSLFFIPFAKLNGRMEPILPVGWTLNYEMFFYLLFFVGLYIKNLKTGVVTVIAVLGGLIAVGGAIHPAKNSVANIYTNQLLAEFAFGMILGLGRARFASWRMNLWLVGAVAPILAFTAILGTSWLGLTDARSLMYGIPAAFLVAAALNLEARGWVVRNGFVQLLGAATYAIYLTHFFVVGIFIRVAERHPRHGLLEDAAYVTVGTIVITVIGVVTHLYVEKPLIRLARFVCAWRPGPWAKREPIPAR